ncbi:MAG: DUF3795 domain-containing protein [Candidatus Thermoplasmatota archaeon]|nr:DUF3795 domain-containing protein [Candidatus Thermoplasmatota archaeon]MBU1862198.1 DUF3795 domain-containing protein [Candidatus Omnitrophota bacterium]
MEVELITPCGMNCVICKFHYREKNQCPGCRAEDELKPLGCKTCKIVNCDLIKNNHATYCFECENIPCQRLKNLDKRYRTKYHMSMLENLDFIKKHGIKAFLEKEEKKWTCPQCGGIVTCHGGMCLNCGYKKFTSPKPTKNIKK